MSLTLYGGQRTRASMPRWYLEEKGIAYKLVELDLQAKQHREPDYLAINPFGKLPALVDDSLVGRMEARSLCSKAVRFSNTSRIATAMTSNRRVNGR